jgi:hypothetical protein
MILPLIPPLHKFLLFFISFTMTREGSSKSQNPPGRIRQRRDTRDQRTIQPSATSGGIQKVRKAKRNRLNATIQDLPIILEHPPDDSDLPPRTGEVISSDEEEQIPYQPEIDIGSSGSDHDSAPESDSGTEKDTPTRAALERIQRIGGERRVTITTRPLTEIGRHLRRPLGRVPPTSLHLERSVQPTSSSIGLGNISSTASLSLSAVSPSNDPSSRGSESIDSGWCGVPSRRNNVTGPERILQEAARARMLRLTLFTDPFPSAPDLTSYIYTAWQEAEMQFLTKFEASPESIAQVSILN